MAWRKRRGGNPDTGDSDLVKLARDLDATVWITSLLGFGFPDWVVGFRGLTILVERKRPGGDLRESQHDFRKTWKGGTYVVIETADELVAMLTSVDVLAWIAAHMDAYDAANPPGDGSEIAQPIKRRKAGRKARGPQRPVGFRFADELPFDGELPQW
jgi:hypothetical protein